MPTTEELAAEEKDRKARLAQEAKRILDEPMIKSFFKDQAAMCHEAFMSLPMGSKLEEYQTVHHDLLAVKRLEAKLELYIKEYQLFELYDSQKEVPEI